MSTFVLVVIACISMFFGNMPFAITFSNTAVAEALIVIGKLYFPIMAFLIVEGYCHNKNFSKYFTRVCVFALISQIFSLLLFKDDIVSLYFNEFFTLALGLFCVRIIDKIKKRYISYPIVIILSIVAEFLGFDYGLVGILMVATFYIYREKPIRRNLIQILLFFILYFEKLSRIVQSVQNVRYILLQFIFSLLPLLLLDICSKNKPEYNKKLKIGFYCFYPFHLALLALIKFIF